MNKKNFENIEDVGIVEKTIYRISLGILFIAIISVIIFLYWYIVPINVIKINNNPVPVEKTQIKGSDVEILDINYCKYQDIKGSVTWSLVSNKQVILLPPYVDTTLSGCNVIRAPILLPPVKFSDVYHFHYVLTYQVNPLKTEVIIFDSKSFKILGLDGK